MKSQDKEKEYERNIWEIYRKEFATANREKRLQLNKRMRRWQELMKSGWPASQAYYKVMEEESDETPQPIPAEKQRYQKTNRMMTKVMVGVVIAIIALVVCLVPLKEVAYTVTEPLSYQVTNFVQKEQRQQEPGRVETTVRISSDLEDFTAALQAMYAQSPVGYVDVVNRDTVSGTFTVHFTFYSSGDQYSKDVTLYLKPDELGEAKYQATSIDANDEWSWEYKITPDTKIVTNYKKVPLLEYLLSR